MKSKRWSKGLVFFALGAVAGLAMAMGHAERQAQAQRRDSRAEKEAKRVNPSALLKGGNRDVALQRELVTEVRAMREELAAISSKLDGMQGPIASIPGKLDTTNRLLAAQSAATDSP